MKSFRFWTKKEFDEVLACCMIAPLPNGEWEIEKFCARGMYTGTGAGSACLKACIDYAKEKKVDKEKFPFDRADIAFEQVFHY